ncbi:hypothetical protein [Ponticaulis koreensis]|uniref:hypothetical protein n=1 Tax=Ponticaulis koreensis TaxID=1123045 RepID=UPI0012DED238|nr:hypothetical protein [Ponticaulis koreensis]
MDGAIPANERQIEHFKFLLDQMADQQEALQKTNSQLSQLTKDFAAAVEKSEKSSRTATWIAISAIVIAAATSFIQIGVSFL